MSSDRRPEQKPGLETQTTQSSWQVSRRLLVHVKPYWKSGTVAVILQFVLAVQSFLPAYVIGRAVNSIQAKDLSLIWVFAGILVVNEALRCGVTYIWVRLQIHVTARATWDMQLRLYDALQRMSVSYHGRHTSGQLISRMISDMQHIGTFYRMICTSVLDNAVVYGVGIVYLFVMNWQLALLSLAAIPFALWVVIRFSSRVRKKTYELRQQYGELQTALSENLAGVQVVRAFAREKDQIDKFEGIADSLADNTVNTARIWAFNAPLVNVIVTLGLALTFYIGGRMAIGLGDAQLLGTVVSFFFILRTLSWRVGWIGRVVSHAQQVLASADRVFELLDEVPEIRDRKPAKPLPEGPGRVVFENVSFAYGDGPEVLKDISLAVEPGQMVALVGRTGAGKSTLMQLLSRFYDVKSGRILIDGHDVRDMTLESLRSDIGLVFQDSFLFSRTVAENIAYADPSADMSRIKQSAEAARADEFIRDLPDGYDTVVGERGVTLSGGQRQRLTIARALMKDPRILILDDSTSSVDPETEREIHEALMHLAKYRTTFVIAHRLSTVRRADVIVVLENGRIAEMGTHEELISRKGGIYKTIRDMQLDIGEGPAITDDIHPPRKATAATGK